MTPRYRLADEEIVRAGYARIYRRARRLIRDHAQELNGDGERLLTRAAFSAWLDSGRVPDHLRRGRET